MSLELLETNPGRYSLRCAGGNEIEKCMGASVHAVGLSVEDQLASHVLVLSREIMLTLALCQEF